MELFADGKAAIACVTQKMLEEEGTSMEDVVNASVSQTITRNINTSITTFIMIFMLFLLGVSSLREFTVPLMAGILGGAFSSICLTGPLWCVIKKAVSKKGTKAE